MCVYVEVVAAVASVFVCSGGCGIGGVCDRGMGV